MEESNFQSFSGKPIVLAVDSSPDITKLISETMSANFQVLTASSGYDAVRQLLPDPGVDLVLLDVALPDMDVHQVLETLQQLPQMKNVPILLLAARAKVKHAIKGLKLGAADFIQTPIVAEVLLARAINLIELKYTREKLHQDNQNLELKVSNRTRDIAFSQDATIMTLAALSEIRDQDTGQHLMRTRLYVETLANALRDHQRFGGFLTQRAVDLLVKSAPLHDLGKVGVPDSILQKPGPLTDDEFAIMKKHVEYGYLALDQSKKTLGYQTDFLEMARELIAAHHECWNGSGYPKGLKGNDIPIPGRLMALADVYDALISQRCYKPAMAHETAVEIIKNRSGTTFDPDVVDAFLRHANHFKDIANAYKEPGSRSPARAK